MHSAKIKKRETVCHPEKVQTVSENTSPKDGKSILSFLWAEIKEEFTS